MTFSENLCLIAANLWGTEYSDMMGRNRLHHNVVPRQAVMHALREIKAWSYPQIARVWCMDHTTVMHGIKKSQAMALSSEEYALKFHYLLQEGERLNDQTFRTLQAQARQNIERLSVRLYMQEVCALAGIGPAKLRQRIAEGTFPQPVDYGNQLLFDREEVLRALNIGTPAQETA
jgi:predicted DNA-binding transcriptional regulator AlpA